MGRASRAYARRERLALIESIRAILKRLDSHPHPLSLVQGRPSDWYYADEQLKHLSLVDLKGHEAEFADWLAALDGQSPSRAG